MAELILALDVPGREEAERLLDRLPGLRWVKVGPVLFLRSGPDLVRALKARGLRVFLDLKWHDIPNTVAAAVDGARELGVDLATVHALGGREMLRAAVEASGGLRLAAVSVLTSHGAEDYWGVLGRAPTGDGLAAEVGRLAGMAVECGVQAVVASPQEIRVVRRVAGAAGDVWIVTPGIRPAGSGADDQRRTADPATAIRAGATHLVVGRPITRAIDPLAVYEGICQVLSLSSGPATPGRGST